MLSYHSDKRYLLLEWYVNVVIPFLTKSEVVVVPDRKKSLQAFQAKLTATWGPIMATKFLPAATVTVTFSATFYAF
jgi:hypothetical protein